MRTSRLWDGLIFGTGVGIVLIGLLYLGEQLFGFSFFPFTLFDWLARNLPGDLVTFGIDSIVSAILLFNIGESTSETAKLIEQGMALVQFVVLWAIAGLVLAAIHRRRPITTRQANIGATLLAAGLIVIGFFVDSVQDPVEFAWVIILLVGGLWALNRLLGVTLTAETGASDRRQFLLRFGGAVLGLAAGAWGLGWALGREPVETGAEEAIQADPTRMQASDVATDPAQLQGRLQPAPGTRAEITPEGEFYRIDINTRAPVIDEAEWQLEVDGLFDNPRSLSLTDLMVFPAVTQPLTLSCISNRIGGDLISTAEWTGVRLGLLLEELGLQPEARELAIEAEDGFYESVASQDMMDPRTLLVYAMNGETLPHRHGYPLRIYIPNRYGMKQPKWITRIEAIPGEGPGYWVDRGWSEEARPHIVSIIDNIAANEPLSDGRVPVGGIAWAGARGIEQVEVQIDDGAWQMAELRVPPLSTLTWVQWRYDWPASEGEHRIRVRATDGNGALQVGEESGVRPDGATGYHTVTQTVS